jgi:beta-phosphoglucomutase-like phosphatase (HAD superfamily)
MGKKNQRRKRDAPSGVLAGRTAGGARVAGAMDHAAALLERLVATAPTSTIATLTELA